MTSDAEYELAFDLMRKEPFVFAPIDGVRDLCIPVKDWSLKPKCLGDSDFVFIDPKVLYGFELLPNGLLLNSSTHGVLCLTLLLFEQ